MSGLPENGMAARTSRGIDALVMALGLAILTVITTVELLFRGAP